MHIALVSPETSSLHLHSGGIGSHFEPLARALAAAGHTVTFVTTDWGADAARPWPHGREVRLVLLDVGRPLGAAYGVQRSLAVDRFLRHLRPDVVYAPEWGGLA